MLPPQCRRYQFAEGDTLVSKMVQSYVGPSGVKNIVERIDSLEDDDQTCGFGSRVQLPVVQFVTIVQ